MRRNLVLSLTALLAVGAVTGSLFIGPAPPAQAGTHAPPKFYPNRWVFVFLNLQSDSHVEQIRQIARTASVHGLNGMLLSGSLDALEFQSDAYFQRLEEVKRIAAENSLEIIPTGFSAGYGGAALYRKNRNLAEGLQVKDALFVVAGNQARLRPDPPVAFVNGDFEQFTGNQFPSYRFHDRPGEITFADTNVFHGGRASIRFENFGNFDVGNGRVMQEIPVQPHRCYRATVWVKTEALSPVSAFNFTVIGTPSAKTLAYMSPNVAASGEWRQIHIAFNSGPDTVARIYAGVWGGRSGKFWLDDFSVEEIGLTNVLRRSGTPLTVRGEGSGITYEEGRDYAAVSDPALNFRFDHEGPSIYLIPGGRIQDGERLRVGYYHGTNVYNGQVSLCMSEPEVYEIWADQARRVRERLPFSRWVIAMDEIRLAGSCEACRKRGLSAAQILGDCLTRQFQILRNLNPSAEIFTYSDMLDPNHNARPNYYLVEGDYTGSWLYAPRELTIVCWYYSKRRQSLAHFSGLGFRTYGSAYYDSGTLDNTAGWLETLDETPGAAGIMYTTWEDQYDLLGPFGDLVSRHWRQPAPRVFRPTPGRSR